MISMKTWLKIPAEMRLRLEKAAVAAGVKVRNRIAELNAEALKVMEEHGLKINRVSPEGVEYWRTEFHKKGGDQFIETRYSLEAYERVLRILEDYRSSR